MTITPEGCMAWILDKLPGFRPAWDSHLEWWGDDEAGLGNDMAAFSQYIVELMKSQRFEELKTAIIMIETLLTEGDEEVRTAAATNCLENIINRASNDKIPLESFLDGLGKESRAYCLEWDRFTGAQTPGLAPPEENPAR